MLRVINQQQVNELLSMDECIPLMRDALVSLAGGGCVNPLRPMLRMPDKRGILGLMPAYLDSPEALGVKLITVFNANHGTEYDSHQGMVILFDVQHGSPIALIDASSITAIRTAAVSAVATDALARPDAHDLCIIGSGVQAQTHLTAVRLVREIDRVRVWSRSTERASAFGMWAEAQDIDVEVMPSAETAVHGADIVCTVTSAAEPVLRSAWVAGGAHLNVVGSSTPSSREVDSDLVLRAELFVDRRESALNEAGDILIPRNEGRITDAHILAELGDVLAARAAGRRSPNGVTMFKSLGLGVEDVTAARHILEKAERVNAGVCLELGGRKL